MGSCFAQHLARNLASLGLNYYITERAPMAMSEAEAALYNYSVFSARFGNVYTVRQGLQLFERAFGFFRPEENFWTVAGGFVDPFRPSINPTPFATPEAVIADQENHLSCVRQMFERTDWLIFTLGLTEAWRSIADGAVYPLAPGVAGGEFSPDHHEFFNSSAAENSRDLSLLIDHIRRINPTCRVILTVSPVPLIATYEPTHVWTATTYSKAVLRVAAEEAARMCQQVFYFPSYEIITSPAAGGAYYADDLRQVTDLGVKHVMRSFKKNFIFDENSGLNKSAPVVVPANSRTFREVICDEELIEQSIQLSGMGQERV